MEESTFIICENIGVAGTTKCHVQKNDDGKYEARMGFALMGSTQMDDDGFEAAEYNPFHNKFYDNYASGTGETKEAAVDELKREMKQIADSLWAF